MATTTDDSTTLKDTTDTTTATTDTASTASTTTSRQDNINALYDAQKEAQLAQLEAAYQKNLSEAQASMDKIPTTYQEKANTMSTEYERNKRNFNQQAAANGINTGTASQAELAQNSSYLSQYNALLKAQAEAQAEAQRGIDELGTQYQSDVTSYGADIEAARTSALLDEEENEYSRNLEQAELLASYGDFSGYATLYGDETAANMEVLWYAQNPALAYSMGRITTAQYENLKNGKQMNDGLDENGNRIATTSTSSSSGYSGYSSGSSSKSSSSNTGTDVKGSTYSSSTSSSTSSLSRGEVARQATQALIDKTISKEEYKQIISTVRNGTT